MNPGIEDGERLVPIVDANSRDTKGDLRGRLPFSDRWSTPKMRGGGRSDYGEGNRLEPRIL
jgi:hypothetical protein